VQVLTTSDRTGLVDNAFTAARLGLVGYDVALELARYLRVDDDHTPWKAFAINVRYLDHMMLDSAHFAHWQVRYILLVVALVERWTRDRKVAGLTPGRGAIKSTIGQLSLPSQRGR